MNDIRLIDGPAEFQDLVGRLEAADRYALDTEFHRERTYWPALALLQIAWRDDAGPQVALVDPLAVDVGPLGSVLAGSGTMVAHAADQDLEILERSCGRVPARLLDTQLAAGFAGHTSPSLGSLTHAYLGMDLAKGDRLTDWRVRPLTDSQLAYAAADVDHLLDLADAINDDLERSGRRQWAEEECESLRARAHGASDPRKAWWKLRDSRSLKGSARGVAQEVAAWREKRAQTVDQPVRSVLPDLAVQAIAHRPPTSTSGLQKIRGMEGRHVKPAVGAEILAAVDRGRALPADDLCLPPADEVPKELRAPVALVMAWIAQLSRDQRIDASLLATRSDVATFLRGDQNSRLATGWRHDLVAAPLLALVQGHAALSFDGAGGLVLEKRSGVSLDG
ncbi:MAG TPA: HRDC domain-containing protein [Acidimicrobiales bacterium]|jgi:ribonuclease D|nr:HRDC domain-containing protein [Acidimicrobiales bacterium]